METMKVAIPMANGLLTTHFGHCASFALVDVDMDKKTITGKQEIVPPPHEPGLLPKWLGEQGVQMIIAGGMGSRAKDLFGQRGITVVTGAPCNSPEVLVADYLAGTLKIGENGCDH